LSGYFKAYHLIGESLREMLVDHLVELVKKAASNGLDEDVTDRTRTAV